MCTNLEYMAWGHAVYSVFSLCLSTVLTFAKYTHVYFLKGKIFIDNSSYHCVVGSHICKYALLNMTWDTVSSTAFAWACTRMLLACSTRRQIMSLVYTRHGLVGNHPKLLRGHFSQFNQLHLPGFTQYFGTKELTVYGSDLVLRSKASGKLQATK